MADRVRPWLNDVITSELKAAEAWHKQANTGANVFIKPDPERRRISGNNGSTIKFEVDPEMYSQECCVQLVKVVWPRPPATILVSDGEYQAKAKLTASALKQFESAIDMQMDESLSGDILLLRRFTASATPYGPPDECIELTIAALEYVTTHRRIIGAPISLGNEAALMRLVYAIIDPQGAADAAAEEEGEAQYEVPQREASRLSQEQSRAQSVARSNRPSMPQTPASQLGDTLVTQLPQVPSRQTPKTNPRRRDAPLSLMQDGIEIAQGINLAEPVPGGYTTMGRPAVTKIKSKKLDDSPQRPAPLLDLLNRQPGRQQTRVHSPELPAPGLAGLEIDDGDRMAVDDQRVVDVSGRKETRPISSRATQATPLQHSGVNHTPASRSSVMHASTPGNHSQVITPLTARSDQQASTGIRQTEQQIAQSLQAGTHRDGRYQDQGSRVEETVLVQQSGSERIAEPQQDLSSRAGIVVHEVPEDQNQLLDKKSSWIPSMPGNAYVHPNIPIATLSAWNERAIALHQSGKRIDLPKPASQTIVASQQNNTASQRPATSQAAQKRTRESGSSEDGSESGESSEDDEVVWEPTPSPRAQLPPDSSGVVQATQIPNGNVQRPQSSGSIELAVPQSMDKTSVHRDRRSEYMKHGQREQWIRRVYSQQLDLPDSATAASSYNASYSNDRISVTEMKELLSEFRRTRELLLPKSSSTRISASPADAPAAGVQMSISTGSGSKVPESSRFTGGSLKRQSQRSSGVDAARKASQNAPVRTSIETDVNRNSQDEKSRSDLQFFARAYLNIRPSGAFATTAPQKTASRINVLSWTL